MRGLAVVVGWLPPVTAPPSGLTALMLPVGVVATVSGAFVPVGMSGLAVVGRLPLVATLPSEPTALSSGPTALALPVVVVATVPTAPEAAPMAAVVLAPPVRLLTPGVTMPFTVCVASTIDACVAA